MEYKFSFDERIKILSVKHKIQEFVKTMKQLDWYQRCVGNSDLILTGGITTSLLHHEIPKDWDFYFVNKNECDNFTKLVKLEKNHIMDVQEHYKEILGQDGKMITANSITMNNDASFVTMITGTPEEVREHFDYVHCMPYYSLKEDKFYISYEQYVACMDKSLMFNNESAFKPYRHSKFIDRGFTAVYNVEKMHNKYGTTTVYTGPNS